MNAALVCVDNRLHLYGGGDGGSGVVLTSAVVPAGLGVPRWGPPTLLWSCDQRTTGCVEKRSERPCEFDGKLTVTSFGWRVLAYTRANHFERGGRHVQLATSADGISDWSRFRQLRIDSYAIKPGNNIYFFTVRPVLAGACRLLFAAFPAVIDGDGGVYVSVSGNGLRWARALSGLESHKSHNLWATAQPCSRAEHPCY